MPRILVIGGGFTGAAFALHLMWHNPSLAADIEIIEPRPLLGAGLAYSTVDPAHRTNVAAVRMAVYAEDPSHFDRWFRESGLAAEDPAALAADGRAFPRRLAFGHYMDEELRAAARRHGSMTLRHLRARAIGVTRTGGQYHVTLDSGETRRGDVLVLAPGHPPPARPEWAGSQLQAHPRFIGNPWAADALEHIRPTDEVLIIGTGLTMADVVASLRAGGHAGLITAASRRGLTPRPRTLLPVEPFGDFAHDPARTASQLLRRVRAMVREAAARGHPWECVVDAIRQQAIIIWQALPLLERRRFLRHLRAYWDVHRYQIAPQVDHVLNTAQQAGTLRVLAARLEEVALLKDKFHVNLRAARDAYAEPRTFDAIVNCTGPDHRSVVDANPALSSLAHGGSLQPDPLGLGILVDLEGRAIDVHGNPVDSLLVAGPLARGTFGELMGLPQVSTQPERVAAYVADRLRAPVSIAVARRHAHSA